MYDPKTDFPDTELSPLETLVMELIDTIEQDYKEAFCASYHPAISNAAYRQRRYVYKNAAALPGDRDSIYKANETMTETKPVGNKLTEDEKFFLKTCREFMKHPTSKDRLQAIVNQILAYEVAARIRSLVK
jgi:hypothetical protein